MSDNRLPWADGAEYRAMHGVVSGYVSPFADVSPEPEGCPRGRQWCDTSRSGCRAFGGVVNLDAVRKGAVARILCAEVPGADDRLTEWARKKADR